MLAHHQTVFGLHPCIFRWIVFWDRRLLTPKHEKKVTSQYNLPVHLGDNPQILLHPGSSVLIPGNCSNPP